MPTGAVTPVVAAIMQRYTKNPRPSSKELMEEVIKIYAALVVDINQCYARISAHDLQFSAFHQIYVKNQDLLKQGQTPAPLRPSFGLRQLRDELHAIAKDVEMLGAITPTVQPLAEYMPEISKHLAQNIRIMADELTEVVRTKNYPSALKYLDDFRHFIIRPLNQQVQSHLALLRAKGLSLDQVRLVQAPIAPLLKAA
jgi:hypothetical protein